MQLLKISVFTPLCSRDLSLPSTEVLLVGIANDFSAPVTVDWTAETAGEKKMELEGSWVVGLNNVLIIFYHLSHVKTCPILQSKIHYSCQPVLISFCTLNNLLVSLHLQINSSDRHLMNDFWFICEYFWPRGIPAFKTKNLLSY